MPSTDLPPDVDTQKGAALLRLPIWVPDSRAPRRDQLLLRLVD
jgi:hypothetical protein